MPAFGGLTAALAIAGAATAAGGTTYGILSGISAKKRQRKADEDLSAIRAADKGYTTPQSVKDQLADAQSRNGAVNPAILAAYQQAQQSGANQASFAQRNASSGAQALSAGADAQSRVQSLLPGIAGQQTAFDQQNRAMYVNALGASTDDARIKYQSDAERNQAAQQFALGQLGAAQQDKSQAIGLGLSALNTAVGAYGGYKAAMNKPAYDPLFAQKISANQWSPGFDANLTPATGASPLGAPTIPSGMGALQPQNLTPLQVAYFRKYGMYNARPFGY